jgi:hypothetical protein
MHKILIAAVLTALSFSANAAPVTWTLDNVIMESLLTGSTGALTGSFDYDSVTNEYSNIAILSTGWSDGVDIALFQTTPPLTFGEGNNIGVTLYGDTTPADAAVEIKLDFGSALTGQGGTIDLLLSSTRISSYQAFIGFGDAPMVSAGTISAVPVPAAVWLFGSGLGLLGWMRRRKTA